MPPLGVRTLPAPCENGVDAPPPAGGGVPDRGDVGDEPNDEEDHAYRQVGADREHVPHQRRFEIRPEMPLIGIREKEVEEPHSSQVEDREQSGGHDREDGHSLCSPVDRSPPPSSEQVQDRGDEGAGVADPDPVHKCRDVKRPELRRPESGDAQPDPDLRCPGYDPDRQHQAKHRHPREIGGPRGAECPDYIEGDVRERRSSPFVPSRLRVRRWACDHRHTRVPLPVTLRSAPEIAMRSD